MSDADHRAADVGTGRDRSRWPIKPYYEDSKSGIVIFNSDCREVLPTLEHVDLVLTDPPYGIKYVSGPISKSSISTTKKRFQVPIHGDDKEFNPAPFLGVAKQAIFTGAQYFYHQLPRGGSLHVWDKRGTYKPLDQGDGDVIWHSRGGATRTFYCLWRGLCRNVEVNKPIEHPTQKPVELMDWLLSLAPDAKSVLDPFMGSGTTLVAAKRRGLSAIGIEIEERYCEIAAKRLSQQVLDFGDAA